MVFTLSATGRSSMARAGLATIFYHCDNATTYSTRIGRTVCDKLELKWSLTPDLVVMRQGGGGHSLAVKQT